MNTADWALTISLFSAVVSAAGFTWNVWSKFIYPKPKVLVSFNRMHTFDRKSGERVHPLIVLAATNMGPGPVTLTQVIACARWRWQRKTIALLNPIKDAALGPPYISDGPGTGGMPKKLDVGETFDVYLHPDISIGNVDTALIGFFDSFRRYHLARVTPKVEPTPFSDGTGMTRSRASDSISRADSTG